MKHILILCGVERSGKTNTLKEFFNFKGKRWSRNHLCKKTVDSKVVYAVGANSPQELFEHGEKFVELIEARIKNEILSRCEKDSTGKNYVLILPFTIHKLKNGKVSEPSSIREPITWLKERKFEVLPIYLRKEINHVEFIDEFMQSVNQYQSNSDLKIDSDRNYSRQSRELEDKIKKLPN